MLRALSDCFSEFKATFIELHGVFETVIERVADQGMAYRHLVAPRNALDEIVQVFEIEVVALPDMSGVLGHFLEELEQITATIQRNTWNFGEDSEVVQREKRIAAHYENVIRFIEGKEF